MPKIAYHQLPTIEESESGPFLQNLKVKVIPSNSFKWCCSFLWCKINVRLTLIICFSFVLAYFVMLVVFSRDYQILNGTRRRWQLVRNQVRHSFGWAGPVKYFGNNDRNLTSRDVDDWKALLDGNGDQYFVYSAYLDHDKAGNRSILRIVAVAPSYTTQKFECYLKDEDENTYAIVPGHVETGKTYIDAEYSAAFIICSLYLTISSLPEPKYVTISPGESSRQDEEPPTLRVHQNLGRNHTSLHEFGVCVQPIFSYDDTLKFVQWMEYNILMGATHFTFYNISIGPGVSCVLEEYKNSQDGIQVEVLPWSTPIQDDDLLHNNGQYSQASDCVLRSRGEMEHLLMIDLDEYIVPNSDRVENYGQLFAEISAQAKLGLPEGKDAVQFGFANGIFDLDCDIGNKTESDENQGLISIQDLIIYRRITRPRPVDYGQMKFITTPNLVIEPGIHNLANSVDEKYVEFQVKPDLAYLHHYKGNGANNEKCNNPDKVDKTGQFYAEKLLPLVNRRLKYVQKYCKFKSN